MVRPGHLTAFIALLFALMLTGWAASPVLAQSKNVALVIGNDAYQHAPPLTNPSNDARAVATTLKRIGFNVLEHYDLDKRSLESAMQEFADQARRADIGLVYFAGHGIQVQGDTYLIPTDVALDDDRDIRRLVPAEYLLQDASRAARLGLVILDACRDNPFIKRVAEVAGATRSMVVGRGLRPVARVPKNALLAYATQSGNVALDSTGGKHSPYAAALIEHLATPNKDVRLVFGAVRDAVIQATDHKQEPYTYGSLSGEPIYLNASTATASESIRHVPQDQLATSAPLSSTYAAWTHATATDSWDGVARIANRQDESVFPHLAVQLMGLRQANPNLTVTAGTRNLAGQPLRMDHLNRRFGTTVQANLRDLNYFSGRLDGRLGRNSRAALDAFARDAGMGQGSSYGTVLQLALAAETRAAQSSLTGLWRGRYFYPRPVKGVKSVEFEMDLTFSQGRVSGFVTEPNTFGRKTSANLYANFTGAVTGNHVEWTKTYDGTAGVKHSVRYVGAIDRSRRKISGKWIIKKNWSGKFSIALQ